MRQRSTSFMIISLVMIMLSGTSALDQKSDAIFPVGKWSGSGTFFKQEAHEKFGSVAMVLESTNGVSVAGKVGGATLVDGRARKVRELIEITGKLAGAVGPKLGLESKDRFVLLVTSRGDSAMRAEFHLKSNAWFDGRMMEGRVALRRQSSADLSAPRSFPFAMAAGLHVFWRLDLLLRFLESVSHAFIHLTLIESGMRN